MSLATISQVAVRLKSLELFDVVWDLWIGDLLDVEVVQSPGKKPAAGAAAGRKGGAAAFSEGNLFSVPPCLDPWGAIES